MTKVLAKKRFLGVFSGEVKQLLVGKHLKIIFIERKTKTKPKLK